MTKDDAQHHASSILGPVLAAEGNRLSDQEIAKRFLELATAIYEASKEQQASSATVGHLKI